MVLERGFEVDHSTINRRILAYALVIEKRQRQFRPPHCGSVGIDETYVKSRGTWRYLYCAIDKHGNTIDLALTAKRDLDAVKRFFRKMLKVSRCSRRKRSALMGPIPFLQRSRRSSTMASCALARSHYFTKHLQQGVEGGHFRVKKNMPKIDGFQSCEMACRTIAGFEAMPWLKKGFGFTGD